MGEILEYIVMIVTIFVYVGPIYIGLSTINNARYFRGSPLGQRLAKCRNLKFVGVCIALLLLIPGQLIYSTLFDPAPAGEYTMSVPYKLSGTGEIDDENGHPMEVEYHENGTATATIEISYDVEREDDGETMWGGTRHTTTVYNEAQLLSFKLDCENDIVHDHYDEIDSNDDCETYIEYGGIDCGVTLSFGEISDDTLGYTLEDRINGVKTSTLVIHGVLILLDLIGLAGAFIAEKYHREHESVN